MTPVQQILLGAGGGVSQSETFDFTGGSAPSGWTVASGSSPTLNFDGTGAKFSGNATNNAYRLRSTNSFTGDYLFQISTRIDDSSSWCNDAGMGLFNINISSPNWDWAWSTQSNRIAVQNDCPTPVIYGTSATTGASAGQILKPPTVPQNDWITMHMKHEPSISNTSYSVTLGNKDWNQSGTRILNWITIGDTWSGTYYWGITCDFDNGDTYINGARYEQL